MATVGFVVIVIGYALAGIGAALLYFNTPPDIVPLDASKVAPGVDEGEAIVLRRQGLGRYGFLLLMVGAVFQLVGVILQWASTNWPVSAAT